MRRLLVSVTALLLSLPIAAQEVVGICLRCKPFLCHRTHGPTRWKVHRQRGRPQGVRDLPPPLKSPLQLLTVLRQKLSSGASRNGSIRA